MITRAIIEEKITEYSYRVRIPIFDRVKADPSSVPTNFLNIAVASFPKGVLKNLQVGDIVFVGFENNDAGSPVILGHLYRESLNSLDTFIESTTLNITNQATLPENTSIGDITYQQLYYLNNVSRNI